MGSPEKLVWSKSSAICKNRPRPTTLRGQGAENPAPSSLQEKKHYTWGKRGSFGATKQIPSFVICPRAACPTAVQGSEVFLVVFIQTPLFFLSLSFYSTCCT